jgi:hypothetical protein
MTHFNIEDAELLETQDFPSHIIILENYASKIKFDKSLDDIIYRMTDSRLEEWDKEEKIYIPILYDIITEALSHHKPILVLEYNPIAADFLNYFIGKYNEETTSKMLCFIFFHNEKDTKKIEFEGRLDMTNDKERFINQIENCNLIKKIIVPLNFSINEDYINRLVDEI